MFAWKTRSRILTDIKNIPKDDAMPTGLNRWWSTRPIVTVKPKLFNGVLIWELSVAEA